MNIFKYFPVMALSLALISACAGPDRDSGAASVISTLENAASNGAYLYAHQDDLSYGHSWEAGEENAYDRSDVKEVCGDYPAIVGFDLGGIELGADENLDGVPFDFIRQAALAHVGRGGIVTFSWHPRNPLTEGDAWDVSSDQVVASILEGGECHELFMTWLERAADFLSSIKDSDGKCIPAIIRPWHENIGSWFWWGGRLCSPQQYKDLFALTYDYFVNERGLRNLVWAYSPNSGITEEEYMSRYPGDEYVDILGLDHYEYLEDGALETFEERIAAANAHYISILRADLGYITGIAASHGKVVALTETGLESLLYPKWWTEVLQPALEGFPVSYVLTWRNACTMPTHFYAPYPGFDGADNFNDFYKSENTYFLSDIQ